MHEIDHTTCPKPSSHCDKVDSTHYKILKLLNLYCRYEVSYTCVEAMYNATIVVEYVLYLDLHRNRSITRSTCIKIVVDIFSIGIILDDTMIYWRSSPSDCLQMSS